MNNRRKSFITIEEKMKWFHKTGLPFFVWVKMEFSFFGKTWNKSCKNLTNNYIPFHTNIKESRGIHSLAKSPGALSNWDAFDGVEWNTPGGGGWSVAFHQFNETVVEMPSNIVFSKWDGWNLLSLVGGKEGLLRSVSEMLGYVLCL